MKFVKKLKERHAAKTAEHEDLISFHLHKTLCAGTEPKWRTGRIHASDLAKEDFCPRFFALLGLTAGKQKHTTKLATVDQLVFKQGRMHATMVIDWAARAGIARGSWVCVRCGHQTGFGARPTKCLHCGAPGPWRYRELVVTSQVNGVSGGIDLLVQLPGRDQLVVVELKSYPKEKFADLKMPLAEHRERTNLYLRLVDESDLPEKNAISTKEARILYVTKGGWGRKSTEPTKAWGLDDRAWTPFHEFVVKRNDYATDYLVEKAKPFWEFRNGGPIPHGICPHALSSTAQTCEMASVCFSGKFPGGGKLTL